MTAPDPIRLSEVERVTEIRARAEAFHRVDKGPAVPTEYWGLVSSASALDVPWLLDLVDRQSAAIRAVEAVLAQAELNTFGDELVSATDIRAALGAVRHPDPRGTDMYLRLGNLTPQEFATKVGTEFTAEEMDTLRAARSGQATLTGPEDFHIFDAPAISVTLGSRTAAVIDIFKAAHERQPFNREVAFDLDESWALTREENDRG